MLDQGRDLVNRWKAGPEYGRVDLSNLLSSARPLRGAAAATTAFHSLAPCVGLNGGIATAVGRAMRLWSRRGAVSAAKVV